MAHPLLHLCNLVPQPLVGLVQQFVLVFNDAQKVLYHGKIFLLGANNGFKVRFGVFFHLSKSLEILYYSSKIKTKVITFGNKSKF